MNYRHAYHAGNFADVMKHALLVQVIEHLKQKEKPFFFLDTHAGSGMTDLSGEEAQKTGEFRDGIARLFAIDAPHPALQPYLDRLRGLGCDEALRLYPGSPRITRELARAGDRFAFCEMHPDEAARLKAEFRRDTQASVHEMDGYAALKSLLPPRERRGAVLIDPPFESRDEFDRVFDNLKEALRRWPGATYLIWYPVKDPSVSGAFLERMENDGPQKSLMTELYVRQTDPTRLSGCGLTIINPPFMLAEMAADLLPWLATTLKQGENARGLVEWLRK
jgi:23S rRNA (adenine2030-N6)-methyltransferase